MTEVAKLRKGDFKAKLYLGNNSIGHVRDIFRARTNMVEEFKGNVKNKYKNYTGSELTKVHKRSVSRVFVPKINKIINYLKLYKVFLLIHR